MRLNNPLTTVLLSVLFCFGITFVDGLTTYTLPYPCTGSRSASYTVSSPRLGFDSSGIVRATSFGSYSSYANCSIRFVPPAGTSILLSLRKLDMRSGSDCRDNVTIIGNQRTIRCGSSTYYYDTLTSNSDLTIIFQSGPGLVLGYSGFEFVFTTFTTGFSCYDSSQLFKCNNGRCIYKRLKCDGYNHCGDRSDQNCGPTTGAIAGAVVGTVFLVIAIIALVVYCRSKRRVITSTTTTYPSTSATRYMPPPQTTTTPYGSNLPPPVYQPPPMYQPPPVYQQPPQTTTYPTQTAYNPDYKH